MVVVLMVVVVPFERPEALGLMTVVLVWSRHHCHLALVLVLVLRGVREVSFLQMISYYEVPFSPSTRL